MNQLVSDTPFVDKNGYELIDRNIDSQIKPIRECLAQFDEDLIARLNILHERGIYAKTQVQESAAHWRLEHASQLTKNWIKLTSRNQGNHTNSNAELWIAVDQFPWSTNVNDRHWRSFGDNHLPLAFSIAYSEFLAHLQVMTDTPWRIASVDGKPEQARKRLACYQFSVEHNQQISTGAIAFSDNTLANLTTRNIWHRASLARHEFIIGLSIPLSIEIPVLPLDLQTLCQFAPGDLLLCGHHQTLTKQMQLISFGSRRPLCQLLEQDEGFKVVGPFDPTRGRLSAPLSPISELTPDDKNKEANVMQKDTAAAIQKDATTCTQMINELPVDLSIEIGNLNMTVGELDNIEPGHILKLPPECPTKQARLIANGLAIGRGELVMVGDQLAIRLTELAK